ncbi:hypothetical protein ACFV27_27730 [Streptomyces antimycoticus]|uniref:Lipoprotein n=2 Tax=Streptomyces violaceusniger group TaxID=2839105 RepID=A0ABD5JMJ1_9ACTN|nr:MULTISPECIES: hypothetical protein [Streptomyces]KUL46693.1 hypothetical protein ADL28_34935 [Streptomyces violaceusniger]MEE4589678.1 hypothetical protein [Streptomyces sp. DSM 41602]RSS48414.1 hypothetical protein EF902_05835 [Streptomyces sp. WAC05858]WJD97315.1 hypothetical protein QR300_15710 [Streptomyces antimycoticus]
MNTATTTKRFRGRAGRRIAAAIVAAAALGLGATACGPDDSESAGSSNSSAASASQDASATAQSTGGSAKGGSSTGGSSSDSSGSQGQNGGGTGGGSASSGGGVANAGNHHTYVGKLQYLAPGKLIVHPEDGSTDQAFYVSNATQVLGAAAICGEESGHVALGEDGYGTTKCTVDDLEKAAKTGSVTVRVTLSTKSAGAETVEEKYHP